MWISDKEINNLSLFVDVSHLSIVSQSVLSYIKTISPGSRLTKISNSIFSHTSNWLSALFFSNSIASFLPTNTECLAKTLRLALARKFEKYPSEGFEGLKPVSIYINSDNPYLPDLKFAVHSISLPQSCIKIVSCPSGSFDVAELEKIIEADKSSSIVPLVLFADLGSSLTGGVDGSVKELSELSEKHDVWLHLSGSLIASFALAHNQAEQTRNVRSMTLELECLLGLPACPTVLLYKAFPALSQSVFEIENEIKKIEAFPLWTVLQSVGRERIINAIIQAFQSCRVIYDMISKIKGFRIMSKAPLPIDDDAKNLPNVAVVLFQFDGCSVQFDDETSDDKSPKKILDKESNILYYSRLNSWLFQTLERDFPQVQLSLLDDPIHGTCIRFSPLELSMGEKVRSLLIPARIQLLIISLFRSQQWKFLLNSTSFSKLNRIFYVQRF